MDEVKKKPVDGEVPNEAERQILYEAWGGGNSALWGQYWTVKSQEHGMHATDVRVCSFG